MVDALDRVLSGSPHGFKDGIDSANIDPDSLRQLLLTIGRGAVAEPVSGLVGLGSLPWGIDKAVSNMESVNEYIGYQGDSQDLAKYIGQVVKPATDWAKENIGDLRDKAGSKVLETTGSPGLAALAASAPEVAAVGLTGGAMLPAVRTVSRAAGGPGSHDASRRKALGLMGGAGVVGAGLALAPKATVKGLMDIPAGAASKAAPAATSAVAKAIPRAAVSGHTLRMIQMLNAYPALKTAFKKGGRQGFTDKLDDIDQEAYQWNEELNVLEDSDGYQMGDKGTMDEYWEAQTRMDEVNSQVPYIEASDTFDKHGRRIKEAFDDVDWDKVKDNLDNNRIEVDSNSYDYDTELKNMEGGAMREFYENADLPPSSTYEYMVGNGKIFSEKDFRRYLTDKTKQHPEMKKVTDEILNNPRAYDDYRNTYDQQMKEYGMEYYF